MKKSRFNLSHPASFTAKMGNLIPFCVLDCLPGDTHRIGTRSFIRVQPMLAPLMHQVNFFTQWWFVPYRILWKEWQDFITGGQDGTSAPTFPTIKITPETSSLADYFGIPPNGKELEVSALPFRAYAEIWNTRYRDEDLQLELPISYESGLDTTTSTSLKRCAWAKDYFTTSRPFTQRGAQISVPVIPSQSSGSAYPVYNPSVSFGEVVSVQPEGNEIGVITFSSYSAVSSAVGDNLTSFNSDAERSVITYTIHDASRDISVKTGYFKINIPCTNSGYNGKPSPSCADITCYIPVTIDWKSPVSYSDTPLLNVIGGGLTDTFYGLTGCRTAEYFVKFLNMFFTRPQSITLTTISKVDLSTAGAVNIRDLRLAGATQRYQENSMQWGNRYEEFIQREFKIRPRDARIQRPEYLGGAKTRLQISEVLQTAEGTDTGVGTMRGHGVGAMSSRRIKFTCPEHGIIIGLFSIRPHSITTQGLNRFWRKFSKFDFFTPEFAHIGMQEVFQSELYANGDNYDTVFGYSDRYGEYRKIPARISGEFRNLLDYWNLARIFDAPPVLNSSFIEMNPSTRIFAEQTQDQFLCMLQNDIFSYRPVPKRAKNILM